MAKSLVEMAVEIVSAQLLHLAMTQQQLVDAIRSTFNLLSELHETEIIRQSLPQRAREFPAGKAQPVSTPEGEERARPAEEGPGGLSKTAVETAQPTAAAEAEGLPISPEESIQQNKVICLECGREFKQLTHLHLRTHGLTPREYKKKHGLRLTQPLTARSISERRSQRAREIGLAERAREARRR